MHALSGKIRQQSRLFVPGMISTMRLWLSTSLAQRAVAAGNSDLRAHHQLQGCITITFAQDGMQYATNKIGQS